MLKLQKIDNLSSVLQWCIQSFNGLCPYESFLFPRYHDIIPINLKILLSQKSLQAHQNSYQYKIFILTTSRQGSFDKCQSYIVTFIWVCERHFLDSQLTFISHEYTFSVNASKSQ